MKATSEKFGGQLLKIPPEPPPPPPQTSQKVLHKIALQWLLFVFSSVPDINEGAIFLEQPLGWCFLRDDGQGGPPKLGGGPKDPAVL